MIATSASREEVLSELRGVWQDFVTPGGQPSHVLEDINLAIHADEVVAQLGPSGCGKSTLLRILAGLIPPTRGEVLYHGQPLFGLNPGVAIVFQSFALFPWMTVRQNVECVLQALGLPAKEVDRRAEQEIQRVGLAGSENCYPRELSGGMKQRAGLARALSLDPEILLMDEPFSSVDALTAESLRAEVIDIWSDKQRLPSAILLVSHDIKEVAYMADRIVVLGAHPGRVRTVIDNPLPRPRDMRSPEFLALVDEMHDIITGHELPDVAVPALETAIEPLPDVRPGEVVSLLEYLHARGGRMDIFHIAAETHHDFGQVIKVVKAAEMLDLVDTPKRLVVLEPAGQKLVAARGRERKHLWREQLRKLALLREVTAALAQMPGSRLCRSAVQHLIGEKLPQENRERTFYTLVAWARFGDLLAYDDRKETLRLLEDSKAEIAQG